eukprot:TRINITY_DN335_c0_g1_i1.p1 TRINITY_DN335_c0_g1~~TRINITY_DN335_c0_g1_i1.p1  ORF type:complete len:790 (-),score=224.46 TRINITY_DN335_c0_g1_i1:696-3065(-)
MSDLSKQSKGIGKSRGTSSKVHRHIDYVDDLLIRSDETVTTMAENWLNAVEKYGDHESFGVRSTDHHGKASNFVFETYEQVHEKVVKISNALQKLGFGPGDKVGIYAKNCPEWVIIENACNLNGIITVALYDTLGPENLHYVVSHAELSIIFASPENCLKLLQVAEDEIEGEEFFLKNIVCMHTLENLNAPISDGDNEPELLEDYLKNMGSSLDITIHTWKKLLKSGRKVKSAKFNLPAPEDLAIIMYTSGTTGNPKGVMITHLNVLATVSAGFIQMGGVLPNDRYLSYLPLAHILERIVMTAMIGNGCTIGFYRGDPKLLIEDIGAFKPTVIAGVPRVFDKIYDGILAKVQSGKVSNYLFNKAYKKGEKAAAKGKTGHSFLEKKVFGKAQKRIGGCVRLILSGGAPLSASTHQFCSVVFGCPVLQGYGLTETCAGACITNPADNTRGVVGPPLSCCEIKLVSIEDMNYDARADPPEGEVWIRGNCVSMGYFKQPDKTAEDFDEDGWFHSGDVGRWNSNGTLSIIDRKKNIFKLSQGEYIIAEFLEGLYTKCRFLTQFWVYGDSEESCIIGIGAANPDTLPILLKELGLGNLPFDEACQHPDVRQAILEDINTIARNNGRAGFEIPRMVYIHPEEFNTENGLATPTMKLKRPQLREFFQEEIDNMYQAINSGNKDSKKSSSKKKSGKSNGQEPVAESKPKSGRKSGRKSSRRHKTESSEEEVAESKPKPGRKKSSRKNSTRKRSSRKSEKATTESELSTESSTNSTESSSKESSTSEEPVGKKSRRKNK